MDSGTRLPSHQHALNNAATRANVAPVVASATTARRGEQFQSISQDFI